ncbi:MAG: zf-HC2 domain-containing protein [Candidatus Omnitrophica bacterium]|nr:zf-HC2 domain-containing protein [Candidatus Omnitrophota bacterium]
MRCKKVQHFLLTDYLDGCISKQLAFRIDQHLARCNRCSTFYKNLKKNQQTFRHSLKHFYPEQTVWLGILKNIEESKLVEKTSYFTSLRLWLKRTFDLLWTKDNLFYPRYVLLPVLIFIVLTIIFIKTPFYRHMLVQNYLKQEVMSLARYDSSPNNDWAEEVVLGTAIEKYFF